MWRIIVHGGVADFQPTREEDDVFKKYLEEAKKQGEKILKKGGSAIDAVEACIHYMESSNEFNAGLGSVKNKNGAFELDGAIMNGENLAWGAVGAVKNVHSNPISMARIIMEDTGGLLVVGRGAEKFVQEVKKLKRKQFTSIHFNQGTVGCCALDQNGNLCAGNASVVGAGLYANNITCAIASSGVGEEFIKHSIANSIHMLMKYSKYSLKEACEEAIKMLPQESGGIIALSGKGNLVVAHNCKRFYVDYSASKE